MKKITHQIIAFLWVIAFLLTCTKDTLFDPSDTKSVVCYAFLSDTLLSTITIQDSSKLSTIDTIHTADSVVFIGFVVPSDGNIKNAGWDFGDNTISEQKLLKHKYAKGGIYTAVFTIEDQAGFFMRDTVVVHVNTPPDSVKLLLPENGQSNIDPNTDTRILRWTAKDADKDTLLYSLYFNNAKEFFTPIKQTKDTAINIVELKKLTKLTAYFWMVSAIDKYGDVSLSDTFYFRTKDPDATTGSIEGYAYFQGWKDHRGIKISVIDTTNLVNPQYTSTDASGYFFIGNLFPKLYQIIVRDTVKQEFISDTGYVTIITGVTTSADTLVLKDPFKPIISNNSPTGTQTIRQPQIAVSFSDIASGIHKASAMITINDSNHTKEANITSTGISWTPGIRLPDGVYSVKASVSDSAENEAEPKEWNFTVDAMKLYAMQDTTVVINSPAYIHSRVSDVYSKIIQYKWDFDGNGTWDDSINTSDTTISRSWTYTHEYAYNAVLYARDDSGMVKFDTVGVTVKNNAPVITSIRTDTTISIKDSIALRATAIDNDGTIREYAWDMNGDGTFEYTSGSTIYTGYKYNTAGVYNAIIRVKDDDGKQCFDTAVITVLQDVPIAKAGNDTIISINDTIRLHGSAIDAFGVITKWEWDLGNTGMFKQTSTSDTNTISLSSENLNYACVLKVTDDDGNEAKDTVKIIVLKDAPFINLGEDTTVSINDSIKINGTVTQQFGTFSLSWNIDNSGFIPAAKPDTIIIAPAIENLSYQCILKAEDDDGNIVYDTLMIRVETDPPVASVIVPDSAKVDSSFIAQVWPSSPGVFGKIIRFELSVGSYNNFKEISIKDTVIYTSSAETDSFVLVLRVTDDDENVDLDTEFVVIRRTWEVVGVEGFSDGEAWYQSLAFGNGTPYVAYRDIPNGGKTTVMQFNATKWEPVGNKGFSDDSAKYQSLEFWNGMPYVAFSDGANSNKTTVMRFNGTQWEPVGNKGFSDGRADCQSLAFGNGTPYVAFLDWSKDYRTTVMRFNGTQWEPVGNKGFSDAEAYNQSLAFWNGTPYVAFADEANFCRTTVMRFNGTQWEPVGIKGFTDHEVSGGSQSLAFWNGTPYVAFSSIVNNYLTTVMRFNGTQWELVGNKGFSGYRACFHSLVIWNGIPYVAFQDGANGKRTTVMRYR